MNMNPICEKCDKAMWQGGGGKWMCFHCKAPSPAAPPVPQEFTPEEMESAKRSAEQAARGELHYLGSFAKHAVPQEGLDLDSQALAIYLELEKVSAPHRAELRESIFEWVKHRTPNELIALIRSNLQPPQGQAPTALGYILPDGGPLELIQSNSQAPSPMNLENELRHLRRSEHNLQDLLFDALAEIDRLRANPSPVESPAVREALVWRRMANDLADDLKIALAQWAMHYTDRADGGDDIHEAEDAEAHRYQAGAETLAAYEKLIKQAISTLNKESP